MYYKILNLPKIPTDLLEFSTAEVIRSADLALGRTYIKNGQAIQSADYTKTEADEKLKNWIVDNVPGVTSDMIFLQAFGANNGATALIHSDILRVFALNYIIDTGGTGVTTTWYQEHGHPLSRYKDPAIHGVGQSNNKIVEYNNCTVLEQVQFEKHQWSLIRTDVLHDVDHLTGVRSAVSIAILPKHLHIIEQLTGRPFDPDGPL
jgi:hypothetical protein